MHCHDCRAPGAVDDRQAKRARAEPSEPAAAPAAAPAAGAPPAKEPVRVSAQKFTYVKVRRPPHYQPGARCGSCALSLQLCPLGTCRSPPSVPATRPCQYLCGTYSVGEAMS